MGYPAGVAGLTHSSSLKRRPKRTHAPAQKKSADSSTGDKKTSMADESKAKASSTSSTVHRWVRASTRLFTGPNNPAAGSNEKRLTTENKSASATASTVSSFVVRRPATIVRMCTPRPSVQVADVYTPLSPPPPYAFDLPAVHTRVATDCGPHTETEVQA